MNISRILLVWLIVFGSLYGQTVLPSTVAKKPVWSVAEFPISQQLRGVRLVDGKGRWTLMTQLSGQIRELPTTANQLRLAITLASLATEGDGGSGFIQSIADTIIPPLQKLSTEQTEGQAKEGYRALASLVRYEGAKASLDSQGFREAMSELEAEDALHSKAEFTLKDLDGKEWNLAALKGKVVMINFWATWCPPCRNEMPELIAVYKKFEKKGFVLLAISDEEGAKVRSYALDQKLPFPVLLDSGGALSKQLLMESIPKTLVFDRGGKMVAKAVDQRSKRQLEAMLSLAGLN